MIILDIEMAPELGELFAGVVQRVIDRLDGDPPQAGYQPQENDLAEIWSEGLKRQLKSDGERLVSLLTHPHFGDGEIELEGDQAEAVCRSASAIRLGIRETELREVSDEELEEGEVDPERFDEPSRRAFFCYWFLGGIQEMLIRALDPDSEDEEDDAETDAGPEAW